MWILFGCLVASIYLNGVLIVAVKGAMRREDEAEGRADQAEERADLAEDIVDAYRAEVDELANQVAAHRRCLRAVPDREDGR